MFKRNTVRVPFQLVHEHTGGEIPDFHAWYLPGRIVYPENVSWIVLECTNPGCAGEAMLRLDVLTDGVPLGTVLPDPPGTREKYERAQEEARKYQWP